MLRICSKTTKTIYCFILLFLPVAVISITSIYTVNTPDVIWYKYETFHFSALLIPIIIYGILSRKKTRAVRFDRVIILVFLKDLIFLVTGNNNQYIEYNFSMTLILLAGWSICCVVFSEKDFQMKYVEGFFDLYVVLSALSQLLRLFLRMSTDGRYGAIGLSVGGTGYLCAIYLIYCLYVKEYNSKTQAFMLLSILSLLLSGQRTNLFICLILVLPFFIKNFFSYAHSNVKGEMSKKVIFFIIILILGMIGILLLLLLEGFGLKINGLEFINRTFSAIGKLINGKISTESSVEGRTLSIQAGINILFNNPMGITNNFYDLQYRMLSLNYPTYPHSTLLDCMLLWSTPITLFCLVWLIKLWFRLWRVRSGYSWVILFIIIMSIVWGSPFLNYPILFIELYFITMAQNDVIYAD